MRVYNASLPVDASAKSIADIMTGDGSSSLDISSFGTRSLLLQPKDGDILLTFDRNAPTSLNGIRVPQNETFEVRGRVMTDLRVVSDGASIVAVECRYLRDRTIPRFGPELKNEVVAVATGGLAASLPFTLPSI